MLIFVIWTPFIPYIILTIFPIPHLVKHERFTSREANLSPIQTLKLCGINIKADKNSISINICHIQMGLYNGIGQAITDLVLSQNYYKTYKVFSFKSFSFVLLNILIFLKKIRFVLTRNNLYGFKEHRTIFLEFLFL